MEKKLIIRIMGLNGGGGAERHIYQINRFLIKKGWQVITYIPEPPFKNPISHADIVDMNYIHNINFIFLLISIWKNRKRIKFIHSHLRNANVLAGTISLLLRLPHIITIHGKLCKGRETLRDKVFNSIVGLFLLRAEKVIFISHYVKKIALKEARQKASSIRSVIVYNGSDDALMRKAQGDEKERFFNICIVGELSDTKNMSDLIWLCEAITNLKIQKKIKIHVYGNGPWYSILKEKSSQMDFLMIHGYESDTDRIFSNKHLHIILSRVEGFGRVVTEAMARGIPTLCYAKGAFPELITDGYNGFLVETREELLTKVNKIVDTKRNLNEVAKNARKSFLKNFTVDIFQKNTYRELIQTIKAKR